jgi:hypothetical protein
MQYRVCEMIYPLAGLGPATNALRPSAPFAELLALMITRAHRGLRRKPAATTYLIDASGAQARQPQPQLGALFGRRGRRQAASPRETSR